MMVLKTDNEIELLHSLREKYRDAVYIHLIRNKEGVTRSWFNRRNMRPYRGNIPLLKMLFQVQECKPENEERVKHGLSCLYDLELALFRSVLREVNHLEVFLDRIDMYTTSLWKFMRAEGDFDKFCEGLKEQHNKWVPKVGQ